MMRYFLAFVTSLLATTAFAANTIPEITSLPKVNSSTLIANNVTLYTVSMTAGEADGYNDITCMRILFNYTEANPDQSKARGYLAWGTDEATITKYGGIWYTFLAGGTSTRWGYATDIWGGLTYIYPIGFQITNSGLATGGMGYRTATWSFRVKPEWAMNPLANDVDGWVSDATNNTGWKDSPFSFDVVATVCNHQAAVPSAPIISNVHANTADLQIAPGDPDTNLYSIRISPELENRAYVQADGSIGGFEVLQKKAVWQTVTVKGLASATNYTFKVRAIPDDAGGCPSVHGSGASVTTAIQDHTIDASAPGKGMNRGVIGHATRLDYFPSATRSWQKTWDVSYDTCVRGVAGGLDTDTYNWKDMSGEGVGHTGTPGANVPTTLMWMQLARDHRIIPLVTANTRGIGPLSSSGWCNFYYTDTSIETLKQTAADWVKYINFILPTYRQGDTLPAADQAILDSINWYGRPKLLPAGEPATQKVTYWEMGNEPEVGLPWCTPSQPGVPLSTTDYALRYKEIGNSMLAVDPTIKLGPCITTARPNNAHLDAVLSDTACKVDFISYHPYGPLYWFAKNLGDTVENAEAGLRYTKPLLYENYNGIIGRINANGRNPSDISLIASEYNPSDWQWECSAQIRRMSHALGVAETLFTFSEQGIFAAHYWSHPSWCSDGTETPGYKVYKMAQELWGERLIDSYTDGSNLRLYTTWNSKTNDVVIWSLNFSETTDKDVRFALSNLGGVSRITRKRLANLSGPTSLFDTNDPPYTAAPKIEWTTTDLTGTTNPSDFTVTLPHATITVLVFHLASSTPAQAKSLPNGSLVGLDSMLVTGIFNDYFYVESDDRSSGIRIYKPGHTVEEGTHVSVSGILRTNEHGEREILAY